MKPAIPCLLLLLAGFVEALPAQDLSAAPAFSAPAQTLLKAASAIPVVEGTSVVVISDDRAFIFDERGRCTITIHRIYRVVTQAGVEGWDSAASRWEPWHQQRPSLRARVVTSDGQAHDLDPKTIAEAPVKDGDAIYSDAKILQAPLPAVAPGSVVEEEIRVAEDSPLFAAGTAEDVYFGYRVPVERSTLTIETPSSVKLHYAVRLLPAIAIRKTEQRGRTRLKFTQGPMPPVERTEPYLPFDTPRLPEVAFSTGKSWSDVARAYNAVVEPQIHLGDFQQFAAKARASGQTRIERANALLQSLHAEVRYTGIEFGEATLIPRTPTETLRRKYGDCKDQAAMLVAMLRATGIPAQLALLKSGVGHDIEPDLPGIGVFDHAIVYAPGESDLWADPTDPFSRFGELPVGDQGRMALIVSDSGALVKTPEAPSSENRFTERREFFLSELGKTRVIETTEVTGAIERNYRQTYADLDAKAVNEMITDYAKTAYLSNATPSLDHSAPGELSKSFQMRIEMTDAARGASTLTDAAVAVPLAGLMDQLPEWFTAQDTKSNQRRTADLVLPVAYVGEWHYRIVPPPGFRPAALPDSGKQDLGPAVLTKEFTQDPNGVVAATFRFDTVKRRYSPSEAEELKAAIHQVLTAPTVLIRFEQIGEALLSAGKIREALEEFRRLSAIHPTEGLHHAQMARALLAASAGELARTEARRATELDPTSPIGFTTLAWVMQHDLVGRRFQKGADLAAAEAAYRQAVTLAPDDYNARVNLAILLEHSPNGHRYESKEQVNAAIVEYQSLEGKLSAGLEDNILYALLWAERFDELRQVASKRTGAASEALLLAAIAGKEGAHAAITEASKRATGDQARRTALQTAAQALLKLRLYREAADLMAAAAEGSAQAAALSPTVDALRKTRRNEDFLTRANQPSQVLYRFLPILFLENTSPEVLTGLFSSESPIGKPEAVAALHDEMAPYRAKASKQELPLEALVDLALGSLNVSAEGDDAGGYRLRGNMAGPTGAQRLVTYVMREEGTYKLLSVEDTAPLGSVALKYLERGNADIARRWLDWARDQVQLKGGEDPVADPAFPRFWTKGAAATPEQIRYAAASLMASGDDASKAVPILTEGRAKAQTDAERLRFDVALVAAYASLKQPESLLPISLALLQAYPGSDTALGIAITTLLGLERWDEADRILNERLQRTPNDHAALALRMNLMLWRGNPDQAIESGQKIVVAGDAAPMDLNNLAWSYLVADRASVEAVDFAQKAVFATHSAEPTVLHTLAALYAETGRTAEAQQTMLQGMEVAGIEEPDSSSWFVFGRIAEQYGIREAAIAAYSRVEKPSEKAAINDSTWALAQRRLKNLTAVK
jgi:transglutaminase-like putative cysteine protease/tetratricopeptide (TPR) repeat protein